LSFLLSQTVLSRAQEVFHTDVYDKSVKTLQVRMAGEPVSLPCITLGGGEQVEISFDAVEAGFKRYAWSLVHCDAGWEQSALSLMEYMSGFRGLGIEDYVSGVGTTVSYTHYRLLLPNSDVQFKVSGNYAVRVYDEDHPEHTAFTACFSVVEPLAGISATVTSRTLIDTNRSHQQVGFVVDPKGMNIPYPQQDLKIWVYPDSRRDNAVTGLRPSGIMSNRIEYTNLPELIFDAGNEYRRFEFLSSRSGGMRIADVSFHRPYYHVTLAEDAVRANRSYSYDEDRNGRFFIRCSGCSDPDTEADYFMVHFSLNADLLTEGNVYLGGDIYHNVTDEKSKMGYNRETGRYEKSVLLKQGAYNYRYLFIPKGETHTFTSFLEGDYYQTENEYGIYVYYRPMGERYDRLIGAATVKSAP
jgi:hypothetical protein